MPNTTNLNNKTILVTGAGGFIGSYVVEDLLMAGAHVIGFDIVEAATSSLPKHVLVHPNFSYVIGNIKNVWDLTSVFIQNEIDLVCHLADINDVLRSFEFPNEIFDTNIKGTQNVFYLAEKAKVKKIVYASTYSAESNASPYSYSKKQNEVEADWYSRYKNMKVIGLRFYNVYGPRQIQRHLLPTFITNIAKDMPCTIHKDGEQLHNFIFVRDAAKAVVQALKYGGVVNKFEVGSDTTVSVNEIYDYLCIILKKNPGVINAFARKGDYTISHNNIVTTTMDLLAWEPKINLSQGLGITCESYLKKIV